MKKRWLWLLPALLLALLAALPFALDTPPGRALLARQIPGISLESGLYFRVQRIEGSLWTRATLIGVTAHDPRGQFASIDRLELDWQPLKLLGNRFEAREVTAGTARIARWPDLLPSKDPRLLPKQDIAIAALSIQRLELADGLAGKARTLTAGGRIDIETGRAKLALQARMLDGSGGDTLDLLLDAEPDADRFKLAAKLMAPAGGLVTTLAGLPGQIDITANGDGRWQRWDGKISASMGPATTALIDLALVARDGKITAAGRIDPAQLLSGSVAALLNGGLGVTAQVVPDADTLQTRITLAGSALSATASGRINRASEQLADTEGRLTLADSAALARDLGLQGLVLTAKAAGPLLAPLVDARLMLKSLGVGSSGGGPAGVVLGTVSIAGIADLQDRPLRMPVQASVASVGGLTETLDPIAGAWRGNGQLRWEQGQLLVQALRAGSGPVQVTGSAAYRPATGVWATKLAGNVRAWAVPQIGSSDGIFTASLQRGPGNRSVVGNGGFRLNAANIPPGTVAKLAGGPAVLAGRFNLAPGLVVTLADLAVTAPRLTAQGSAGWQPGGAINLAATGRSRDWGPFTIGARGTLDTPQISAQLPRPGYGFSNVAAQINRSGGIWQIDANGQSAAGLVTLAAGLGLDPRVTLDVARLAVAGFVARGQLSQTDFGPFAGTLTVDGQGLTGSAVLATAAGEQTVQTATMKFAGSNVRLAAATPVSIDRLSINARLLLAAAGADLTGDMALTGLERGSLLLDTATGSIRLVDGRGTARLDLAGISGEAFKLAFTAKIAPGRYEVAAGGDYAGRTAQLAEPAVITNDDAGWHLAPVTLTSTLGNAEVSGDWGNIKRIDARLDKVSLQMIAIAYPSLNLIGRVSGTLALRQTSGATPTGTAALRLNGLSRSTVAATSTPIDVGLNAALGADGTVLRAVVVRAGKIEGRAQARLGPFPGSTIDADGAVTSALVPRLFAASVTGQLRYAGPAQDFWGLSGLTALDVRGDVQLAADVSGTLGDPQVAGRIQARDARVEVPVIGAVATNASLDARFTASVLELTRFSGTSGSGSIAGSGKIDLSYERGFPMDIRVTLKDAAILGRDDITATGSGQIRIATDEYGGVVSGPIRLSRAEYRIGRTGAADVPVLTVTEKNTRVLGRRIVQYVAPTRWLYNLNITADRNLKVTGMGINSEWQADVRLRGGATAPEVFGRVQLVRGDYDFAGKRFVLTRGDIRFVGGYPPDPIIAVAAESAANGFTALLNIDGTAQRPQIAFSSVPALPEDEVLSRVLFGARVTDLSAPEAIQLAGALASLRGGSGGGFNPIGAVSRGLGIDRLRILPADIATGRRTTVAAGQYLGRNVYVEIATDAAGYTATSIEIGLTRSLSVLSSVATLGGTSASVRWTRDY
ncbi:translocation/assembly module TamB domain-containing protein [Sandarakinorhabdus sp.]|uniref:translocation/assembly module TamB domain-containing protein n=1 Tax=Sandarakinorhabdus sp. TaxID=1916663 RepID=UPI003F704F08